MKITILIGGHRSIELPLSDEELNFQMRQMGMRETIPKGKLVKVSEKDNPLQKLEGQFLNMDEVNFFARRMEHLTEYERKVLAVYANDCDVSTIKDLINLTFSMKGLSLLTDFSDASQVGVRLYTDEFSEIPEEQMDFTEFAKNALKESNVKVLPYSQYKGEFADPLEITEEGLEKFCLFSPLIANLNMRGMTEMECGDIVKLSVSGGKIILSKVDIVEMGSQDPETMEAYVNAAVKQLNPAKQVALAARILKFAQQET